MLFTTLFIAFFIMFLGYFIFSFFTVKGRLFNIKLLFHSEKVVELTTLEPTKIKSKMGLTIAQEARLYQSVSASGTYYILETTQKTLSGFSRNYTKLTPDALKKIMSLSNSDPQ